MKLECKHISPPLVTSNVYVKICNIVIFSVALVRRFAINDAPKTTGDPPWVKECTKGKEILMYVEKT